jgi:hypothetical protein
VKRRKLALLALLLGVLAACGHYGAPIREGSKNDDASHGAEGAGRIKAPKDRDQ